MCTWSERIANEIAFRTLELNRIYFILLIAFYIRFHFRTVLTEKGKNADEENYNPFEHRDMENANS